IRDRNVTGVQTCALPISTMSSTTAPQRRPRRRMPFHRWFAELGWRHIVGVLATAFAVFTIMFVISASLNESGSIAAAGLLPTEEIGRASCRERGEGAAGA